MRVCLLSGLLVASAPVLGCAALFGAVLSLEQAMEILLPVDEAVEDRELVETRARLMSALRTGNFALAGTFVSDTAQPLGLDEDLRTTLGRSDWDQGGVLWALQHGGAFTVTRGRRRGEREFCAPYPYALYPDPGKWPTWLSADPAFIVKPKVRVHARPTAQSRVVAVVSYALVVSAGSPRGHDKSTMWAAVELPNELHGYVLGSEIWTREDEHVCLAREPIGWRVVKVGRDE